MTQKSRNRIKKDARRRGASDGLVDAIKRARFSLEFAIDDIEALHNRTDIPVGDMRRVNGVGAVFFEFRKWLAKYELDITEEEKPQVLLI